MSVKSADELHKELMVAAHDCACMHQDEHARTAAEMANDPDMPRHDLSFVRLPQSYQGPKKR